MKLSLSWVHAPPVPDHLSGHEDSPVRASSWAMPHHPQDLGWNPGQLWAELRRETS